MNIPKDEFMKKERLPKKEVVESTVQNICPCCNGYSFVGKKLQIQYREAVRLFFEKYPDGICPELKKMEK